MRLREYITEKAIPDLKDGEYAVPYAKRKKVRDLNPKTNRMKNFKRMRYFKTDIPPEKRTFKNMPKDGKCRFQDWLCIKGDQYTTGALGADGKYYGWSHRAVHGFGVGDVIKPGHIGNKYQYTKEAQDKYNKIADTEGYEAADKWMDSQTFEPYTIETEEDAKQHAIRFGKDVS